MKKKLFGMFLFLILTFGISTSVLAVSPGDELLNGYLHMYGLAVENASRFDQMGVVFNMEDALLSLISPQLFFSDMFVEHGLPDAAMSAEHSLFDSGYPIENFFDDFCEIRGGYYRNEVFYERGEPVEVVRISMAPVITRSPDSDAIITEADIDFLMSIVEEARKIDIPIGFIGCFLDALEEQNMMSYFMRRFFELDTPDEVAYAQTYGSIMPHSVSHHNFSGHFRWIEDVHAHTSVTFGFRDQISYSISMDRPNTVGVGLFFSGHMHVFRTHHNVSSGQGSFIADWSLPWLSVGVVNWGSWDQVLYSVSYTLTRQPLTWPL